MEEEAGNLAREGLRTLAVACRELTQVQCEPSSAIYLGHFNLGHVKLSAIYIGDFSRRRSTSNSRWRCAPLS